MTTHLDLEALASLWISKFPAEDRRILKGLQLAKREGSIAALSSGLYLVRSSAGDTWYQVAQGYCECADSQYRGVRCAHRWALSLLAKTGTLPLPSVSSRQTVPTVQIVIPESLAAAGEAVLGPAPESRVPASKEVEEQWTRWEDEVASLTVYGEEADRWRKADRTRRQRANERLISAHQVEQAQLRDRFRIEGCGTLATE